MIWYMIHLDSVIFVSETEIYDTRYIEYHWISIWYQCKKNWKTCKLSLSFMVILDVCRCFIRNKTTFDMYCLTQWIPKPPRSFEIQWVRLYQVYFMDLADIPSSLQYKTHFSRQLNWWSLRCSWSIACRRCSNYIFILNSIPGFNGLGKDNNKMRREAFKFWVLVRLILETLR